MITCASQCAGPDSASCDEAVPVTAFNVQEKEGFIYVQLMHSSRVGLISFDAWNVFFPFLKYAHPVLGCFSALAVAGMQ